MFVVFLCSICFRVFLLLGSILPLVAAQDSSPEQETAPSMLPQSCLVPFFVPLSTLGSAHAAPVTGSCFALRQARAQGIFSLLGFSGRWFLPEEFSVLGQARPLVRTARVSASSSHGHRR
jgi:hypothetical protein